ncbi:hypothetical protein BGW39_003227 [Mortierella sp. 14UC]|nr:hypothetical protein BGW39_003227 [Mortierella sp. 14UC]
MSSIPCLELNLIKSSLQKAGTSLTDVKFDSINEVLTALSAMEGPDDSLKRPHSLIDVDNQQATNNFKQDDKRQKRPPKRNNGRSSNFRRNNEQRDTNNDSSSSTSSASPTKHCDNCGDNKTHDTSKCLRCNNCKRYGHTAQNCKTKRPFNNYKSFGKDNSDKKGK